MRLAVKPALKEDVPGIIALHKDGLKHYTWSWDPHYVQYSVSHGHYYVMRYRRKVVGAIKLRVEHTHIWICTIAVDKELRGQGLGRKLIRFAGKYAKRYDRHKLKLDTLSVSKAQEFYNRLGFKLTYDGPYHGCRYQMYELKLG